MRSGMILLVSRVSLVIDVIAATVAVVVVKRCAMLSESDLGMGGDLDAEIDAFCTATCIRLSLG